MSLQLNFDLHFVFFSAALEMTTTTPLSYFRLNLTLSFLFFALSCIPIVIVVVVVVISRAAEKNMKRKSKLSCNDMSVVPVVKRCQKNEHLK